MMYCICSHFRIPLAEHADASVPVHLVAVECTGVERNITQCRHGSVNNFIHENDAYVVCWPNRTVRYSGMSSHST